ncbi:MAG: SDR family NAD(P)-dependent oxidoreductase [Candidatus Peregrinibacteria bacterium]|nr:SDR family NAD(P)-dependent oxidoreductase [Candidatus Peregrinibacteria bacterium]MCB9808009.1 SDR family NAD(P)-dependent oxidoreductase [Candidatus Peribacteria bacterium]
MKILVTGSSGTIGTRLCETLLSQGHEVIGADWEPCKWNGAVENLRIDIDLRDASQLSGLSPQLSDVELIIHLAANARVYELVENPDRAFDNMQDTFNILEFARKHGIKKLMFASSRETYGNIHLPEGVAYSEDKAHFMTCESPYTASKIAGEALFEAYKRCYDMETIIIRFSNVYGMYDDSIRVVPLYFRQAKAGETLNVFGRDKCLDFTYIDDAVQGVTKAIANWDKAKNETYNLAYGEGTTILHLAEKMKELLGSNSDINITDSRTGEVTHYIADISKAKATFGYDPQVPFEEGIKRSVEWYTANT